MALVTKVGIFVLALVVAYSSPLRATVLNPQYQSGHCVGDGTPNCPGSIETFAGDLGTFWASTTVDLYYNQLSADLRRTTKISVGALQSAVFRDTNGHSDFYYQITLNGNAAPIENFFIGTQTGFWLVDVGVKTDSFNAGSLSFVGTNRIPTDISYISSNYPELDFNFASQPLLSGETSAPLIWKTDADFWTTTQLGSVETIVLSDGFRLGYGLDGDVLVPDRAPEPRMLSITGLGLAIVFGFLVRARIRPRCSLKPMQQRTF
jgi:hypothetical protein